MSEMTKERKALMEIVEDVLDESNAINRKCLRNATKDGFLINSVKEDDWGYKRALDTVVSIIGKRLEQNYIGEIEENEKIVAFDEVRLIEYTEKESAEHAAWNEDKDDDET